MAKAEPGRRTPGRRPLDEVNLFTRGEMFFSRRLFFLTVENSR